MNQDQDNKALDNLYKDAQSKGYKKDVSEFKTLLESDERALEAAYKLATDKGYKKDVAEFETLLGLKKKESAQSEASTTQQSKNPQQAGQSSQMDGQQSTPYGVQQPSPLVDKTLPVGVAAPKEGGEVTTEFQESMRPTEGAVIGANIGIDKAKDKKSAESAVAGFNVGIEKANEKQPENTMAVYSDYKKLEPQIEELNKRIDQFESLDTPNRKVIDELTIQRNELADAQAKNVEKLINPVIEKTKDTFWTKDGEVKPEFIDKNFYGFNVPNLDAIRSEADKLFNEDAQGLKRKFIKDMQGSIQFGLDVEKNNLEDRFEKILKENTGKSLQDLISENSQKQFDETYGKDLAATLSTVQGKIGALESEYTEILKAEQEKDQAIIDQMSAAYKEKAEILTSAPITTVEQETAVNLELSKLFDDYNKSIDEIIETSADRQNEYNSRLNRVAQEQTDLYNKKAAELSAKFEREYNLSPDVVAEMNKASKAAAEQLLQEANKAKEKVISSMDQTNQWSNRLMTSTMSSIGGLMAGWAVSGGGDGAFGDKVEQYWQPSVSPVKSFKDMTLYSFEESSGNLLGSMMPSVAASLGTAALTKNASMTTRILATGAAGWATETIDIAGRQYKEALERTGSEAEAKNAASEAIDAQIAMSYMYLADGLPFIGAYKKIANPVLRIGTGATVEYVTEGIQEYGQGLAEKSISGSRDYENWWSGYRNKDGWMEGGASMEAFEENMVNVLPASLTGVIGSVNAQSKSILDTNPDIAMQQLGDMIIKKGKPMAKHQISLIYSQGLMDKQTFNYLGQQIDNYETANSKEYNAIMFKKDQVNKEAEKEEDPVKKKVLNKVAQSYDVLMEDLLMGRPINMNTVDVAGKEYLEVTNNPIKQVEMNKLKDVKITAPEEAKKSKTTVEQYGDEQEVKSKQAPEEKGVSVSDAITGIVVPASVKGRLLNEDQSKELQKEIESKQVTNSTEVFDKAKDDIRMKAFSYDEPIAKKEVNGVDVRITEGLIRNNEKSYLLYADGKIVGEFETVDGAKKVVGLIEENLVPSLESNTLSPFIEKFNLTESESAEGVLVNDPNSDIQLAFSESTTPNTIKLESIRSTKAKQEFEAQEDNAFKARKWPVKLTLISPKQLANSKNPIENKLKHDDIKDRYKKLKAFINCL